MLAYLFWHWPLSTVNRRVYEQTLVELHHALADVDGFVNSATFRVSGLPWVPAAQYEDWYLVEGYEALESLRDGAVSGARRPPHDHAAASAAGGTAGLAELRSGSAGLDTGVVTWFGKPSTVSYAVVDDLLDAAGVAWVWQRQLVLGPQPEFCVAGTLPAISQATTVPRRRIDG